MVIQDLEIFKSNHILNHMSPNPDKTLDEGSETSRLILRFLESGEAPKDASQNGQGEVRLEAIGSNAIILLYFSFCC